jgi:hypothetical protein
MQHFYFSGGKLLMFVHFFAEGLAMALWIVKTFFKEAVLI